MHAAAAINPYGDGTLRLATIPIPRRDASVNVRFHDVTDGSMRTTIVTAGFCAVVFSCDQLASHPPCAGTCGVHHVRKYQTVRSIMDCTTRASTSCSAQ